MKSKATSKTLEGTQKPHLGRNHYIFLPASMIGVFREKGPPQWMLHLYKGNAQFLAPKKRS